MPSHRIHRGLVALSASAVAAIYMAGYLRTQAADASIAAAAVPTATVSQGAPITAVAPTATPPPPIVQTQPQPPTSARPQPATLPTPQPAPTAQPTPAVSASAPGASTQTQSGYKDGTFTGQGTSLRGDLSVSVQIQGGRITNVTITRSSLQYPLRDIANLPNQVVQRQSAQVDTVSRATYSSMAFRGAVTQALSAAESA
ncbi:MAG TPA: FMN-binding protein [Chloroflexota bacterium]